MEAEQKTMLEIGADLIPRIPRLTSVFAICALATACGVADRPVESELDVNEYRPAAQPPSSADDSKKVQTSIGRHPYEINERRLRSEIEKAERGDRAALLVVYRHFASVVPDSEYEHWRKRASEAGIEEAR